MIRSSVAMVACAAVSYRGCGGEAPVPPPAEVAVVEAPTTDHPVGEPSPAFAGWVDAVTARGFAPAGAPDCVAGATLAAWRENPTWTAPSQVCGVDLDRAPDHRVSRISESAFASAEEAELALIQLRSRSDGTDPSDLTPDKSLVSGWTDGPRLFWVTTRANMWEDLGCEVLAAAGQTTRVGMHDCG